jgi:cytochrome c553
LWSCRALWRPGTRYALTDLRLVRIAGDRSDELIVQEIGDVHRRQSWIDHLLGTSTIVVDRRGGRRPPIVLSHVRRGAQLAALLELLSSDSRGTWDPESVRAALKWEPAGVSSRHRKALVGLGSAALATAAVAVGWHGSAAAISYPFDDAIYPGGVKRDRQAIVRFMEEEVMPWARQALAPIKGPAAITCETCHGQNAESRLWQMPAVAALPEPYVTASGWEVYGGAMDAQMRNAIYGYSAESDNQTKATYMRKVIMPGMARLLHRPAYDFTRTYDYNRGRLAFGCYHCHRVK